MSGLSDARERLARSRQAILETVHQRERRHDPHEEPGIWSQREFPRAQPPHAEGWSARLMHAVRSWWEYHPAHLAVDIATPVLESYAERRPMRLLGFAALIGGGLMLLRPWRLISASAVLVALLKSSQLSGILMSALSAADYRKDHEGPG